MIRTNELETRMEANLIESLQEIRDFRAAQGSPYPLWLILLLIIMGTLVDVEAIKHWKILVRHYPRPEREIGLTVNRLPSDTTFHPTHRLNFQLLAEQFRQWVAL